MRLKLSREQFTLYALFEKRNNFETRKKLLDRQNHGEEVDFTQCWESYGPVPRINLETLKYSNDGTGKVPNVHKLAEKRLYTTFEEAEALRTRFMKSDQITMETLEIPVNKRIQLPEGNTNYSGEPMILLDMTNPMPHIMYVHMYFELLSKLGVPCWIDIEMWSKGRYVIMPLETFEKQFSIQVRPEYIDLMETSDNISKTIDETDKG